MKRFEFDCMLEYFLSPALRKRPFADRCGVVRPLRTPWLRTWDRQTDRRTAYRRITAPCIVKLGVILLLAMSCLQKLHKQDTKVFSFNLLWYVMRIYL